MKFQHILSMALTSSLVISGSAYASQILTESKTPASNTIHTVNANNTGSQDVYTDVTITVGTLKHGFCSLPLSGPTYRFDFNAGTDTILFLNGDALWRSIPSPHIPSSYNCGWVTFHTDKQTSIDSFALLNNGSTYTGTNPFSYWITVN